MYRYKLNFIIYTTISFERFTSPLNPKWFASLCFVTKTFSQMFIKNANHSVVQALRSTGPAKIASCTIPFSEIVQNKQIWACSAVGSAPHSHCGGRRFESDQVHQEENHCSYSAVVLFLYFCIKNTRWHTRPSRHSR